MLKSLKAWWGNLMGHCPHTNKTFLWNQSNLHYTKTVGMYDCHDCNAIVEGEVR
jgi:hypothetical protein